VGRRSTSPKPVASSRGPRDRPSGVQLRDAQSATRAPGDRACAEGPDVWPRGNSGRVARRLSDAERLQLAELFADLIMADLADHPPRE
jgi:hypothetical protein